MQDDRFDIRVRSQCTQPQMTSYLVKAFLGLRDRENTEQSVRILGSGGAIPLVILVTEIIRSRYKTMEKQGNRDPNDKYYIPAIRIKLTLQPSEEEKALNGYQAPNEVLPGKHAELFDYVMLYSKDLYLLKTGNKVQNRSPREHPQRERQGENRQYNSYSQPQKRNEESRNWKDDREKFWQQQQEEQAEQQQQQQQQRSNQQLQNRGTKRRGEFRESNRGDRREQNKEQHRDTNQFRNDNDNEGQQRTNQHHFRKPEDFRRPKDRSTSNDNKRTVRPKFEEQQQEKSIKRGGELVRRGGPRKD